MGTLPTTGPAAEIYRYALPLREPLGTGRGLLHVRRGLLVRLRDRHGHSGWGEAAPLEGWHGPDLAGTQNVLEAWLAGVGGFEDPAEPARRAEATLREVPCAWAAVAGAACDLAARRGGVGLAAFLATAGGGPAAPQQPADRPVATAALVAGDTPDAVARGAAAACAAGHGTLKLKVGNRPLAGDLARVEALRRVAPDAALRLDANGAWGDAAAEAVRALARFEPELIEEPCGGLEALARLQQQSEVPIAADESLPPLRELRRRLPLGVAVAVLKPSALGGPEAVLEATAALAASGTTPIIGSFMESAVGLATAAHIAAVAARRGAPAAGLGTASLFERNVCEPPAVRHGAMWLPQAPGLGPAPRPGGDLRLVRSFDAAGGRGPAGELPA